MKNYHLKFTREVENILREISHRDHGLYVRIANVLSELPQNPFLGKPLKGVFKGSFSCRVGSYRIIYSIFHDILTILVIDVGHRRDIYR